MSTVERRSCRAAVRFLAVFLSCTSLQVHAEPDLLPAFPPGSIAAPDRAAAALAAATRERIDQEVRYRSARNECYRQFLAEQCLSEARLANHRATQRIREVELDARDFQRRRDARLRAERQENKRASEAADAPRRAAEVARKQVGAREKQGTVEREARALKGSEAERARKAAQTRARVRQQAADRVRRDAEAAARAPERAQRARAQQVKVQETLQRAAQKEARTNDKRRASGRNSPAAAPLEPTPAPSDQFGATVPASR